MKLYDHPAKFDRDRPDLCFICGDPVTGADGFDGGTLRHVGQEIRVTVVPREYAAVMPDCVAVVEQALAAVPTERATDRERARVAVEALIEARFLRTSRAAPPKHPARN